MNVCTPNLQFTEIEPVENVQLQQISYIIKYTPNKPCFSNGLARELQIIQSSLGISTDRFSSSLGLIQFLKYSIPIFPFTGTLRESPSINYKSVCIGYGIV